MAKGMKQRSATKGDAFIGQRIREGRMACKMSQDELGKALGVSFQQVQKYEKGVNRVGSVRLDQICKALGKPMSFFFADSADNKATSRDPALSQMFATREGFRIASLFSKLSPRARSAMITTMECLAEAD